MMPHLRIAILTYNAIEFSVRCLKSLADHTKLHHDICVLDNGSEDGTRDWLIGRHASNERILLSPINLGVPKGRNVLLADIIQRSGGDDLIVFLDNDTEVLNGWHDPFLDLFVEKKDVAIAGVTGHRINILEDRRELLPSPDTGPTEVDVVSGYCLWVRASVARVLGPFDENLGQFWHEDDDYCVRANSLGYRVFALPDASIIHHGHKSRVVELDPIETEYNSLRNQHYLVQKWRHFGFVDESGGIRRATKFSGTE